MSIMTTVNCNKFTLLKKRSGNRLPKNSQVKKIIHSKLIKLRITVFRHLR